MCSHWVPSEIWSVEGIRSRSGDDQTECCPGHSVSHCLSVSDHIGSMGGLSDEKGVDQVRDSRGRAASSRLTTVTVGDAPVRPCP